MLAGLNEGDGGNHRVPPSMNSTKRSGFSALGFTVWAPVTFTFWVRFLARTFWKIPFYFSPKSKHSVSLLKRASLTSASLVRSWTMDVLIFHSFFWSASCTLLSLVRFSAFARWKFQVILLPAPFFDLKVLGSILTWCILSILVHNFIFHDFHLISIYFHANWKIHKK